MIPKILRNKEKIIVCSFILVYFTTASIVSVIRYWQFQNFYFDFGIFDRALWFAAHFMPPIVFHPNFHGVQKIIFADHFNPSMFLLTPLYFVTNKREIFLIFQALVVSLSALVGYKLSKMFIKNSFSRIGLIFCYLLFVGTQNALISDIHDSTLATLPLMISFWAIYKNKWKIFFVSVILILGFKESFAGLIIGLGIYLIWIKHFRQGLITILLSILWFYLSTNFVIPYFSHNDYFYSSSSNAIFTIKNIFTPFVKIKTLFYSFLSFGFLPILYPPLYPAIFENFFERFVTLSDTRWGLGLHYSATLAPLFFVSCLHILRFLQKKLPSKVISLFGVSLIFLAIFLHRFFLHGPLGLIYNPAFYKSTSQTKYLDDFVSMIPKKGLIMTQNDISVRLTHYNVTLLDKNYKNIKPNIIALNLTPGQNPNVYFPLSLEDALKMKDELLIDNKYKMTKLGDYLFLFSKK